MESVTRFAGSGKGDLAWPCWAVRKMATYRPLLMTTVHSIASVTARQAQQKTMDFQDSVMTARPTALSDASVGMNGDIRKSLRQSPAWAVDCVPLAPSLARCT